MDSALTICITHSRRLKQRFVLSIVRDIQTRMCTKSAIKAGFHNQEFIPSFNPK